MKPVAYLLTDGSGGTGRSRVESTRRTLADIGVHLAESFPEPIPDAKLYSALLTGDHRPLLAWARALREDLQRREIRTVISDAAEGFNPAHDLCRAIACAARLAAGVPKGYAYLLEGRPDVCPTGKEHGAIETAGSPGEIARKRTAMQAYPELAYEVERACAAWGEESFVREWLFVDESPVDTPPEEIPPAYERFGEARVKTGKYGDVIRYEAHVKPFLSALRDEFRPCGT